MQTIILILDVILIDNMKTFKQGLLSNSLRIYDYISIYGLDRYNSKKDIMLLLLIEDMLSEDCYFEMLDHYTLNILYSARDFILNRNPQLQYCRRSLNNYYNLDGRQNIDTYKQIKK